MNELTSAQELKSFVFRQLGDPVINIEVDDTQADDAIKNVIDEFLQFHSDGYDEATLIYETKKSDFDNGFLTLPENVIGIKNILNNNGPGSGQEINNFLYQFNRNFYWGMLASGTGGNVSGFSLENFFVFREYMGLIDMELIPEVWFTFNPITKKLHTNRVLDVDSNTFSVLNYSESPNFIEVEDDISSKAEVGREADVEGTLFTIDQVEVDDSVSPAITRIYFKNDIPSSPTPQDIIIYTGNVVAFLTYSTININDAPKIYDDTWIRRMAVEQMRLQWGSNLRKYKGVKFPGGVEFNGEEIYKEAKENIKELREELQNRFAEPPEFFVG